MARSLLARLVLSPSRGRFSFIGWAAWAAQKGLAIFVIALVATLYLPLATWRASMLLPLLSVTMASDVLVPMEPLITLNTPRESLPTSFLLAG